MSLPAPCTAYRRNFTMKNIILWIVGIILIWIVAHFIIGLVFHMLHWVVIVGIIALFAYIVYSVYKSSQRQKI